MNHQNFETTIESLAAERAALLENGEPIYSGARHDDLAADIAARAKAAFDEAVGKIAEAQTKAQAELKALRPFDPTDALYSLDSDALVRANNLKAFVADDVENLGPEALAAKIELAIEADDRAAMACYARALATRPEKGKGRLGADYPYAVIETTLAEKLAPPDDGQRVRLKAEYADLVKRRTELQRRYEAFAGGVSRVKF